MDINQFQQRISRIFRSSCRSKHIIDHVVEYTVLPAADEQQHHHHHHDDQLIHLFSPKNHTLFPSLCKPRWHECFQTDNNSSCIVRKISVLSDREKLLLPPHPPPPLPPPPDKGQKCPPASPITPFNNSFYDFQTPLPKSRVKKRSKRASTNRPRRSRTRSFGMNNFPACSYNGLFSSDEDEDDDDDDNTTFFSSRSLSSESSQSFRQGSRSSRAFKDVMIEEDGKEFESSCQSPESETKVENKSFAVMKRSNDPYNDFRTSMVEMIIEKQIFEAKDLEDLLQCFLSLNSSRHHKVIVKVFNEIWEALFFNNNNNNKNRS